MATRHTLLHQRALLKELHVGRDGRAHQPHDDENIVGLPTERGNESSLGYLCPVGMAHKSSNRIGEEHDGHRQKDFLYAGVVSIDYKIPKKDRSQRNSYVLADSDQFHRGANTDKLRNGYAAVGDENDGDRKECPACAKALTNQVQEPPSGGRA